VPIQALGGLGSGMTLKIESNCDKSGTRIHLSGVLRGAHLEDLRAEIARVKTPITIDLTEVCQIDIEGIRWLNSCEATNVVLENHARDIREWMSQEKNCKGI
jgi:hypothetical protein